ncbi:MAG: phage tail length tape measure family protein [Rhodoglobus sp.]
MTTTIEEVLRLDAQQAYAALGGVATAAEQAAFQTRQASVAALGLSDAEAVAAASVRSASEAETLRAQVLGVSVTQLRQMQSAQAALTAETNRVGDAWLAEGEHLNTATGASRRHGAALQNLRFQIADIGTSLASGSSPFVVMAQQGPQIGEAIATMDGGFAGLAATIGAFAVPVAIVAVGLGAVAAALLVVTREIALEAEQMALATAIAHSHTAALRANESAHIDLMVASGDMSEAFAKETRAAFTARDAVRAYGDAQRAQRDELASRAETDKKLLSYSSIFKVGESENGAGGFGPGQLLDVLTGAEDDLAFTKVAVDSLNGAMLDQVAIVKQTREEAQKTAVIDEDNKARKDALTASTKAGTSATKDAASAARDLAAALKEQATAREFLLKIGASGTPQQAEDARYNAQRSSILKAGETVGDPTITQAALDAAADSHDAVMTKITTDVDKWFEGMIASTKKISSDAAAVARELNPARAGGLAGAAGIVSGGAENAIITAIGKIPVLGGIASSLVSITQNTGAFLDGITGFVTGITGNLGNLGADIAGFVIDIFQQILPSLIEAIPDLIEGILVDLVAGLIVTLTDPSFWADIARGLWTSLKESFVEIWQNIGQNIVDAIKGLLGGGEGDGSILRDSSGKLFGGIRGNLSGENRTGTSRQVGEGLGDLMSGQATFSLFHRTNGEQRVGGGVVLGRLGDIAENIKRGVQGRNIGWGNG